MSEHATSWTTRPYFDRVSKEDNEPPQDELVDVVTTAAACTRE